MSQPCMVMNAKPGPRQSSTQRYRPFKSAHCACAVPTANVLSTAATATIPNFIVISLETSRCPYLVKPARRVFNGDHILTAWCTTSAVGYAPWPPEVCLRTPPGCTSAGRFRGILRQQSGFSTSRGPRCDAGRQARCGDFAVGDIVAGARGGEPLARLIDIDLADDATLLEFGDNEIALGIGVGIGGVRHLKCQSREREARILGAGSDPKDLAMVPRAIVIHPKAHPAQHGLGALEAQRPKAHVMTPARAVIDGLLKADILAAAIKIERAERRGRVGPVEQKRPNHAPGTC